MSESPFPERYVLKHSLGRGGGGEVWAAEDRSSGALVALKVLHAVAGPAEVEALLRETTALSGLEGLGFPRVLGVGRGADGRLFLVRELVDGESLAHLAETEPARAVASLPALAESLTVVHRTGLLHGDVKPANAIVLASGEVALVDLGLATALREGGFSASGHTPHYAAPEVLSGGPLTVQGEVYSLGVMLADFLASGGARGQSDAVQAALELAQERATATDPGARYPSADEFGAAIDLALGGDTPLTLSRARPWPVLGMDLLAAQLLRRVEGLTDGGRLAVLGPSGSGRSTLLRRLSWTLGARGAPSVLLDEQLVKSDCLEGVLSLGARPGGILVIDAPGFVLDPRVDEARRRGARVVFSETASSDDAFVVPPLDEVDARELLRGAVPGLADGLIGLVLAKTERRPGALREFVRISGERPLVSEEDLGAVFGEGLPGVTDPLVRAEMFLDRGHYAAAFSELSALDEESPRRSWLLARYELAVGNPTRARELTERGLVDATLGEELRERILVTQSRALLGLGAYEEGLFAVRDAETFAPLAQVEGLAYRGLGQSLSGRQVEAVETLRLATMRAEDLNSPRLIALSAASLGTAEWRNNELAHAALSYERAIVAATAAGDSGMLASAQINLAGLQKERGDLAASIELLEQAADAARRAGRTASVEQALLNLTNLDLYLGRLARARAELRRVGAPESLSPVLRAQRFGLEAELAGRLGEFEGADRLYRACEDAWASLGRKKDAAEAALEAVLVLGQASGGDGYVPPKDELRERFARGQELSGGDVTPLLLLAEARLAELSRELERAEELARRAQQLARERGLREWVWRALSVEADLLEASGKTARAQRARAEAVEVLEEIAARLPPDLRAVYFSDSRRSALRGHPLAGPTQLTPKSARGGLPGAIGGSGHDAVSRMTQTPLERRLAKILAVNSDLAGEVELPRLATKIVGHAAELLGTERGYLLLGRTPAELEVVASRAGQGTEHQEFSRSIAGQVLASGEPLISIDAGRDQRLRSFESVHLAYVSAVACVPVLAPTGQPIGALYLETRQGARADFAGELPTLLAFADQAAIALENARLLKELSEKSERLDEQNRRLTEVQARLKESLGKRTARLREVREELRSTKDKLSSSTGFRGLVGESAGMRRIYALIERVQETEVPVLITGESGTGKEVVARAIHEGSARRESKMLAVNCGAIPETILESELFGHTRGAFTGAERDRKGLFLEASGGTLFLDEIGETPLKMQAGLLRVLQERRVRKVGGSEEVPVDVRVIFATNRDLGEAVARGTFREDLLYRIQVVEIHLPPLRDRRDDIPLLVDHFLGRFAIRFGQEKKTLSRGALQRLREHPLPGNVRQLENVLLNAWVLSEAGLIEEDDLSLGGTAAPSRPALPRLGEPPRAADPEAARPRLAPTPKRGTLSEHQRSERAAIVEALEKTGWNRVRAAEVLGMPRRTFYRRLADYGIQ